MADMLVRLYDLPALAPAIDRAARHGVSLRRPQVWEKALLIAWVRDTFSPGWALECEAAFTRQPAACFIAIAAAAVVGFACHDCTRANFFGPTGVAPSERGQGVGSALVLACLHAMRDAGYAYAIIGGVGPAEFYAKTVDAQPIAGSTPGIYDLSLVTRTSRTVPAK